MLSKNKKNKILIGRTYTSQKFTLVKKMKEMNDFDEKIEIIEVNNMSSGRKLSEDELAESKLLIIDNKPDYLIGKPYVKTDKLKEQIVIQLTHGVWAKQPSSYWKKIQKEEAIPTDNTINYILSANEFSTKLYKKWGYKEEEILPYGFPRLEFYNSYSTSDINNKLLELVPHIKNFKRKVIFAPSWINSKGDEFVEYSLNKILDEIGEDAFLIVGPHYNNRFHNGKSLIKYFYDEKYSNRVYVWDDIYDYGFNSENLMLVCDYLYTDYSSIFFDFVSIKGNFGNAKHYYPIHDNEQTERTKQLYELQYSDWGKELNFLENGQVDLKEMKYYNYDKPEYATEMLIKKILKIMEGE